MFTFKSYIFYCALSLKLSTYDFHIAEITDKTATLKTQHSFFFPITLRLEGEIFFWAESLALRSITLLCSLSQASVSHKIHSLFLRLDQTLVK